MWNAQRRCGAVVSAAIIGEIALAARGTTFDNILPAALDQPQINAIVYIGNSTTPQTAVVDGFDFDTFEFTTTTVFNIPAYLDTGASSILFSTPTATQFGIPTTPGVLYSDVGVGGSDTFQVSPSIRISLTQYYQRTDLDHFQGTAPDTSMYVPLSAYNGSVRAQVGPYQPTVDNPLTDELSQFLAEFSAVDVIGMPAMKGGVVVMNPKPVNNFDQLLNLDFDTANDIPDVFLRTYVYAPGTHFNKDTQETDPGIPTTSRHVKLSYASFDRFTSVTPSAAMGPTLEHNPFIGTDPVSLMEHKPVAHTPGIKITRSVSTPAGTQVLSSEGNWLLDTGAAASMISRDQAAALGVHYKEGTYKTDTPDLVDAGGNDIPGQFTLAIGGIGGQFTAAGFYLDSLLLRTIEGSLLGDDNDSYNILFTHAAVLVADVSVMDPLTGESLTLDGIFGMNFLVASADISSDGLVPTVNDISDGRFNWVTFDEPNGILGLDVPTLPHPINFVPEPGSLLMLGVGAIVIIRRSRSAVRLQQFVTA